MVLLSAEFGFLMELNYSSTLMIPVVAEDSILYPLLVLVGTLLYVVEWACLCITVMVRLRLVRLVWVRCIRLI